MLLATVLIIKALREEVRSSSIKSGKSLYGGSQGFRFGLNKHGERVNRQ